MAAGAKRPENADAGAEFVAAGWVEVVGAFSAVFPRLEVGCEVCTENNEGPVAGFVVSAEGFGLGLPKTLDVG